MGCRPQDKLQKWHVQSCFFRLDLFATNPQSSRKGQVSVLSWKLWDFVSTVLLEKLPFLDFLLVSYLRKIGIVVIVSFTVVG